MKKLLIRDWWLEEEEGERRRRKKTEDKMERLGDWRKVERIKWVEEKKE